MKKEKLSDEEFSKLVRRCVNDQNVCDVLASEIVERINLAVTVERFIVFNLVVLLIFAITITALYLR